MKRFADAVYMPVESPLEAVISERMQLGHVVETDKFDKVKLPESQNFKQDYLEMLKHLPVKKLKVDKPRILERPNYYDLQFKTLNLEGEWQSTKLNNVHVEKYGQNHASRELSYTHLLPLPEKMQDPDNLYGIMNTYGDVLLADVNYLEKVNNLRKLYCLHISNHLNETTKKSKVFDDLKLEKEELIKCHSKETKKMSKKMRSEVEEIFQEQLSILEQKMEQSRDRGYARPTVLILVPLKSMANDVIRKLMSHFEVPKLRWKRFKGDFGPGWEDSKKLIHERKGKPKPKDYDDLFSGNTDDCFQIGIKVSLQEAKIYAKYEESDVIVASPLGFKTAIASEPDNVSMLSSIQIVVLDGAHVMNMQNWNHVEFLFSKLNMIPEKPPLECDFFRILPFYLDKNGDKHRQTIVISEYLFPELNYLYSKLSNYAAGLKFKKTVTLDSTEKLPTLFKVESCLKSESNARFEHFIKTIVPMLRGTNDFKKEYFGILLFVPCYLDFVRIRNHLDKGEFDFEELGEYTNTSDLTRARTMFAQGRTRILLYSERVHFFRRFFLTGVNHVVFYGFPTTKQFYKELTSMIGHKHPESIERKQPQHQSSIFALYSKYDALKMSRIFGEKTTRNLIK